MGFKYEHTTLDSAHAALEQMVEDANTDGFDADNDVDVYYGLLLNLEMDCQPDVRVELWRTTLGIKRDVDRLDLGSRYPVTVAEAIVNEVKPVNERAIRIAKANRIKSLDRRKK